MSGERQVNVKSQSELDIGGRETCKVMWPPTGLRMAQNFQLFPMYLYIREGIFAQKIAMISFQC